MGQSGLVDTASVFTSSIVRVYQNHVLLCHFSSRMLETVLHSKPLTMGSPSLLAVQLPTACSMVGDFFCLQHLSFHKCVKPNVQKMTPAAEWQVVVFFLMFVYIIHWFMILHWQVSSSPEIWSSWETLVKWSLRVFLNNRGLRKKRNRLLIPASMACRHVENLLKPCFFSCVWLCTSKCGENACLNLLTQSLIFPTDTIVLLYNFNSSTHIRVPMVRTETAWWTDKYVKFQNPTFQNLSSAFAGKIHTLAQYSSLFLETLVLICGGMFMIPPSLLLFF